MKFVARFVFHIVSNAVALLAASYFIPGFMLTGGVVPLATAALVLTLINTFIRPILKLLLGPIVVITFGLFTIVINAALLYLLDLWSPAITIQGYLPLLLGTLIVSAVNAVLGFAAKKSAN
ncbi:phage holin family protein [Patescibacteria group bacterium]|nr:phage holin family protein [Patescibacteria group bacterium]